MGSLEPITPVGRNVPVAFSLLIGLMCVIALLLAWP